MERSDTIVVSQNDYIRITPQVWVHSDQMKVLPHIDSLVLDIDGVLIDVSPSFRVAISQAVQHYFLRVLKFKGNEILLRPSETQLFKLAGGFNNDWDLTAAAVLFYLTKAELLKTDDTKKLREDGQTIGQFTEAVRRIGGGIEGAREVMLTTLTREQRKSAEAKWNKDKITEIFQEFYGGVDYCQRLYGFKPKYNRRQGLLNEERVMIDSAAIKPFMPRVAILTGRTKKETKVALETTGLKDLIKPANIVSDGTLEPDKRKPQPGALIDLGAKLGGKVTVYVGDVLDDLTIVKNANHNPKCPTIYLSCIIVSPLRRSEVDFYQVEGADIIGVDVNEVLRAIAPTGAKKNP